MTPTEIILQLKNDRHARASILAYFTENTQRIEELIALSTTISAYPIQEHATWILIHASDQKKKMVAPHQAHIIDAFLITNNQTTLRNLCKTLSQLDRIDYKEGILLDALIQHLKNPENNVALHVYCLEIINQFIKIYPEIGTEIKQIIAIKKEIGLQPSMNRVVREFDQLMRKN